MEDENVTDPPEDKTPAKKKGKKARKDKAPRPNLPPDGDLWSSPVCFDAKSLSQLLREALDALDYKYERKQADKLYQQMMVLFPLPKTAYIYRFELKKPIKVWIDLYDTRPSHAGIIPYMDIQGLTDDKIPPLKMLFDELLKKLSRPPWEFTIGQKFQHGLLIPEWGKAKRAWRHFGYDVKKSASNK
jgi:hypothetical protein